MITLMRAAWWMVMLLAALMLATLAVRAITEPGEMPTAELEENQVRVEQISDAVQAYAADAEQLPQSLTALVPRLVSLRDLEDTRGSDYQYEVPGTGFRITFDAGGSLGCTLQVSGDVARWDCSGSQPSNVSAAHAD
jgi:hypothetical protein